MREITRVGYELDIVHPTIRQAELIYEANEIARKPGGHPDRARQVASLYLAIQEQGDPVSLSDIADETHFTENEIYQAIQSIRDRLNIKIEPRDPRDFIDRFIDQLNEDEDACLGETTREVASSLIENDINRAPVSVAAGAVYLGAQSENKRVTATEMARVANLDPRTVKAAVDELSEKV